MTNARVRMLKAVFDALDVNGYDAECCFAGWSVSCDAPDCSDGRVTRAELYDWYALAALAGRSLRSFTHVRCAGSSTTTCSRTRFARLLSVRCCLCVHLTRVSFTGAESGDAEQALAARGRGQ